MLVCVMSQIAAIRIYCDKILRDTIRSFRETSTPQCMTLLSLIEFCQKQWYILTLFLILFVDKILQTCFREVSKEERGETVSWDKFILNTSLQEVCNISVIKAYLPNNQNTTRPFCISFCKAQYRKGGCCCVNFVTPNLLTPTKGANLLLNTPISK